MTMNEKNHDMKTVMVVKTFWVDQLPYRYKSPADNTNVMIISNVSGQSAMASELRQILRSGTQMLTQQSNPTSGGF